MGAVLTGGDWVVFAAQMPHDDAAARMRVLRTLESLGAAVLREGVYLLPDSTPNRKSLGALADYVAKGGGQAHILCVTASGTEQQEGFRRLFDRSPRYDELVKNVESLQAGFGRSDAGSLARVLQKQRRDFEAIAALDFFPSQARERAEQALAAADAAIRKLLFARTQAAIAPEERLAGRTWATRRPLWADRLASAWLVRRFVDPGGTVLCLEHGEEAPWDAVGFGFPGAHFAASETRVAYEELLARLRLGANPALARIGAIVHYLEMRDAPVPEAAGVQTLLQGAVRRAKTDEELLKEAEKTFDLLYEAYAEPAKR